MRFILITLSGSLGGGAIVIALLLLYSQVATGQFSAEILRLLCGLILGSAACYIAAKRISPRSTTS